jgi:Asp-tRNA(Asn)/Glu-tRNA(Gln) amidotransferase A subunit family amidase
MRFRSRKPGPRPAATGTRPEFAPMSRTTKNGELSQQLGFRADFLDFHNLADRLAKLGCHVLRESPKLPDLALTTLLYRELLAAFYSADLTAEDRERIETAARALSPDDQSLATARLRGLTMSHAEWVHKSRIRGGLRARWQALFQEVDVVLCPVMPPPAFPHDHSPQRSRQLDVDGKKIPSTTSSPGWASQPRPGCPRRPRRTAARKAACRSACRSSAAISKTARRSPSPA